MQQQPVSDPAHRERRLCFGRGHPHRLGRAQPDRHRRPAQRQIRAGAALRKVHPPGQGHKAHPGGRAARLCQQRRAVSAGLQDLRRQRGHPGSARHVYQRLGLHAARRHLQLRLHRRARGAHAHGRDRRRREGHLLLHLERRLRRPRQHDGHRQRQARRRVYKLRHALSRQRRRPGHAHLRLHGRAAARRARPALAHDGELLPRLRREHAGHAGLPEDLSRLLLQRPVPGRSAVLRRKRQGPAESALRHRPRPQLQLGNTGDKPARRHTQGLQLCGLVHGVGGRRARGHGRGGIRPHGHGEPQPLRPLEGADLLLELQPRHGQGQQRRQRGARALVRLRGRARGALRRLQRLSLGAGAAGKRPVGQDRLRRHRHQLRRAHVRLRREHVSAQRQRVQGLGRHRALGRGGLPAHGGRLGPARGRGHGA